MYYKHNNGKILKLIKTRSSNINTFVEVDGNGKILIDKRPWLTGNQVSEQKYLINGFDSLSIIILN